LNVHQDDIGTMRGSGGQRLLAVSDLDDLESGMGEEIAEDPLIVLLVLDNKNALGHAFTTCCSTSTGTSRKNVEPAPNSFPAGGLCQGKERASSRRYRRPLASVRRLSVASCACRIVFRGEKNPELHLIGDQNRRRGAEDELSQPRFR
jgi:hypothetical protein